MKKTTLLLAAIILLISCKNIGSENKKSSTDNIDLTALVNSEISIKGMTCTGCENTINSSINSVSGVKSSKASYIDGKAWVSYDTTRTNINDIIAEIDKTGYEVTGFIKNKVESDTIQ